MEGLPHQRSSALSEYVPPPSPEQVEYRTALYHVYPGPLSRRPAPSTGRVSRASSAYAAPPACRCLPTVPTAALESQITLSSSHHRRDVRFVRTTLLFIPRRTSRSPIRLRQGPERSVSGHYRRDVIL